jgi:hypothetical protein
MPPMRSRLRALLALVVAILAVASAPADAHPSKVRRGPAGVAFYKPRLAPGKSHGQLIWARRLANGAALRPAAFNELLLYRSIGVRGRPVAVSGTLTVPAGRPPRGGWPIVSYAHGTSGIADACAPSRGTPTSQL